MLYAAELWFSVVVCSGKRRQRETERENDEQRRRMVGLNRWMLVNRSCDILVLSVDGDELMKCVDGTVYWQCHGRYFYCTFHLSLAHKN